MIHEYCPSVKNALGPDHDGGESGSRICVRQDCALNALCTSTPLRLVTPAAEKRTIVGKHTAVRRPNKELRAREHLTPAEVERLIDAARKNREGHRDGTMILLAYRHGLRASELIDLRWDQVDFNQAVLHVRRVKNGTPATHPITGGELRTLRRLQREQNPKSAFGVRLDARLAVHGVGLPPHVERAALDAGLESIKAHPHMLRHAC